MLKMSNLLFTTILFFSFAANSSLLAQDAHFFRSLWHEGAPEAKGTAEADNPAISVYLPNSANGMSVLIFPGGGYGFLTLDNEGKQTAEWLNDWGITAFIVRYRISPYRHPIPLLDAKRAMRWVRHNAELWSLDTNKVGIIGFSAGGHLASTLATHYDNGDTKSLDILEHKKSRPDFVVLGYPVITMDPSFTHMGSRDNLLGGSPTQEMVDFLSNEKQVTKDTPPTFLFHGDADNLVPIKNSEEYFKALQENDVQGVFFVEPGMGHQYDLRRGWPNELKMWLASFQKVATQSVLLTNKALAIRGNLIMVKTAHHNIRVIDMAGNLIFSEANEVEKNYSLDNITSPGVYFIRVTTDRGQFAGKLVKLDL